MTKSIRFRDRLEMVSRLRFGLWWLTGGRRPIVVRLKKGPRIRLRSLASTDYGVASDVFRMRCYESPRDLGGEPLSIVDLGANVGYSILHWLQTWPAARIVAFEPHPAHVAAIKENLAINGLLSRVDLRAVAVGTHDGTVRLSDRGSSSSIVGTEDGFSVPLVDLYEAVTPPVDILKVDIEGAEYELLDDPRLPQLAPRAIVIEWHGEGGFDRIRDRLVRLGYSVVKTADGPYHTGLLWAYHEPISS